MAGRSRRLRIEEVQQRWCFSLAASGFWGWRLPFSGGTQALWLLGESIAVNGSMGEIVAPAITGINRPRRRCRKCLCQCRARPEIIIMGEPQVQVTIVGTIIYLLCACFSVHCAHNTSSSLGLGVPILARCCWQGPPKWFAFVLRRCSRSHGRLAVSLSRSGCLGLGKPALEA
ncbi:hypothetical protein BGZ57DRAFT_570512 [Hyaloscypha finlandica]|nr:hypothetical protein BGZ57DRAFT_570512 [Hyaloscypha finlandica]